jgi:hypothetical protein
MEGIGEYIEKSSLGQPTRGDLINWRIAEVLTTPHLGTILLVADGGTAPIYGGYLRIY